MKIATYNVWNSEAGMPRRFDQLVSEINRVQADIICLQEVSDRKKHDRFSALCGYGHSHWHSQAELSILSRYPIDQTADFEYGASARICLGSLTLLVINVHLPWEKASLREKAVVALTESAADVKADYTLMAGDFNCSEASAVHRFLTNEQSLWGADAYYFDLAESFAEISRTDAPATLNFRKNPRWNTGGQKNTIELNQRFDWILLKNPYPGELPELKGCVLFGTEVSKETGLSASDHYGIMAEMEFQGEAGQ